MCYVFIPNSTAHSNIKHYMVDATTPGVYKFIGKYQPVFPALSGLLSYYR